LLLAVTFIFAMLRQNEASELVAHESY